MRRKLVIGLTGGIGSGKSAAAAQFESLGATLVDTDAIAHALTAAGGTALEQVRQQFGQQAIGSDGAMDRARMRDLVFADADARRALESILHPLIREEAERQIAQATGAYVIYAVPLLLENADYRRRVDRVLVVDAPEALQVARVQARSRLSEDEIRAIMQTQIARADRLAAADDVLDNSGDLAALRQGVRALHEKYLQLTRT